MADARAKELRGVGDGLFSKKAPLHSYLQEVADNFYPERADFVRTLWLGQDLTAHLMDSFPLLCRRELGDAISAMLRPRGRQWFKLSTGNEDLDEEPGVAQWLEQAANQVRLALYDRRSGFIRAAKMTDHDYVAFGSAVMSVEENEDRDRFRFRNWHFRDVAYLTNQDNVVDHLHRKDRMTARNMVAVFGDKVSPAVKDAYTKDPGREFEVRHIVMPQDEYDLSRLKGGGQKAKLPYASIYIDVENEAILREGGLADFGYVTPRWHLVSNWQYGFSPASVISVPDARLIQQMKRVILEHGEKLVEPPLIATEEAIRSDIAVYPGGITYVDREYDERLGAALQPLNISGNPEIGVELMADVRDLMARAWYINKLTLPQDVQMTAYEVGQRVEEYVRTLLPFFEPIEVDYNSALLDRVFSTMLRHNVFDIEEMPDELSGRDIEFKFESPLQAAEGRMKVAAFSESLQLVAGASQVDPGAASIMQVGKALEDAIRGTGAPADWLVDEDAAEQAQEQAAQTQGLMQAAAGIREGAGVAGDVANATIAMRQAGMI